MLSGLTSRPVSALRVDAGGAKSTTCCRIASRSARSDGEMCSPRRSIASKTASMAVKWERVRSSRPCCWATLRACNGSPRGRAATRRCRGRPRPGARRSPGLAGRPPAPPARSPWATCTSPILLWLTERSRCQPALPGSAAARRSLIARARLVGASAAAQVALGDLHVADLVVADREVALPAGVAGVGGGQALADRQGPPGRRRAPRRGRPGRPARRRSCRG